MFNVSFACLKQYQAAVWQLLLQNHICGVQCVQQHPVQLMFVGFKTAFDLCWLSYSHQLYMHTAMYSLYTVDLPKAAMFCPLATLATLASLGTSWFAGVQVYRWAWSNCSLLWRNTSLLMFRNQLNISGSIAVNENRDTHARRARWSVIQSSDTIKLGMLRSTAVTAAGGNLT